MLEQGFLRVKGQAQITKCYFLWVDAINKKSLSGHYLMRQQVSMVFSLHLAYFSTAACISEKNKVGSMLAQGFLRVKGQAEITKCYFLRVGAINMQSLSGHYLMRQQAPMVFLLLLVYLGTVAYISVEISLGSFWRRDILRVKGQALFTKLQLFMTVWFAIVEWPLFDAPSSTHGVFTSLVYLSVVAYISVEISLGSCWCGDILRVKGQGFITNCNFLWLCVICNHRVVTTQCAIKYPWCFYFF